MNKKRLRQWMAPFATATLILNTGYGILAPDAVASALQTERHNSNLTVLNTAQLHTKLATAQGRQVPVTSGTKVTTLTKSYGQNTYLNQMLKVMSSQMVTANIALKRGKQSDSSSYRNNKSKFVLEQSVGHQF